MMLVRCRSYARRVQCSLLGVVLVGSLAWGGVAKAEDQAAGGAWSSPMLIEQADQPVHGVQVATGPGSYAVVAWVSGTPGVGPDARAPQGDAPGSLSAPTVEQRVLVSVRAQGEEAFGPPESISAPGALGPTLAVGANGETLLAWSDESQRIHVTSRSLTVDWATPQILWRGGVPMISMGPDGTAVAAWSPQSNTPWRPESRRLKAAVRLPGQDFGPEQLIAKGGKLGVDYAVAAAHDGRAGIAWSGNCPPMAGPKKPHPASVALLRPNGHFGEAQAVRNSRCPSRSLQLGMDDRGGAVLLIVGSRYTSKVRASIRPPGGEFARAEKISGKPQGNFAQLGMDRRGDAAVTWVRLKGERPRGIFTSMRSRGEPLSPPARVSGHNGGGLLDMTMSPGGHALAAWQSLSSFQIQVSYMTPGGRFGSPVAISPPLSSNQLANFSTAAGPSGNALVAWAEPDALGSGIQRGVYIAERSTPASP